jgi:predicted dehydrogenase
MDGGVLSNQASHHIDLLQWIMGPVESVFAKGMTALVNIEAEDTSVVILKFKSGALGLIEATTATRPIDLEGSISVLGSKGTIVISGFAVNKVVTWNIADETNNSFKHLNENPKDVYGFGHIKFYEEIVNEINFKKSKLVEGKEAIKTVEIINAIYESIKTNKEVIL